MKKGLFLGVLAGISGAAWAYDPVPASTYPECQNAGQEQACELRKYGISWGGIQWSCNSHVRGKALGNPEIVQEKELMQMFVDCVLENTKER